MIEYTSKLGSTAFSESYPLEMCLPERGGKKEKGKLDLIFHNISTILFFSPDNILFGNEWRKPNERAAPRKKMKFEIKSQAFQMSKLE